jgi:regulation of enolase protein 1 (concanavalin A-like superfamily)
VTGGTTAATNVTGPAAPYWVRLVRAGDTLTGSISPDGVTWTSVGSTSIAMASNVSIGLAVTSHANVVLCTSVFDNVAVTQP